MAAEAAIGMATTRLPTVAAATSASETVMRILIRRRAAISGTEQQVIPFHRDHSLVVVNVALNDDFDGARLLFASGDRIVQPERRPGDATVHTRASVHAVTCLAAGVRYNFFVTVEAAAANLAPSA